MTDYSTPTGQADEAENIAQRYERLATIRWPYLERARESSKLTIPPLVPPQWTTGYTRLPTPFQSIGARGVNNLASKLLLTLFPPNAPFIRLEIDELTAQRLTGDPNLYSQIQKGLAKIERTFLSTVETGAMRIGAFEALRHLIVAGNILIHVTPDFTIRVIHFEKFVVRRDPQGRVLEIIIKELVPAHSLPEQMLNTPTNGADPQPNAAKVYDLFTCICLDDNDWDKAKRYRVYQVLNNAKVPDSDGYYPKDKSPWIPLRFNRIDGEDYGRGYIEEYLGDLKSLEGLTQSIVEGSAAMARLLILVKPNGITKLSTIAKAPNGAVREGNPEDVGVVQIEKQADLSVASQTALSIEKRLEYAFLLNSAYQRSGERVTQEEIRRMASDLDASLGGIYATLSGELQMPLATVILHQMQKRRRIPALPDKQVRPVIVTGIEALGRGNDVDKLTQFITTAAQALTPEVVVQRVDAGEYLTRLANGLSIDTDKLIKSDQQLQQEQQAQAAQAQQSQMMDMAGKAAPAVVKGISDHVNQAAAAQADAANQAP